MHTLNPPRILVVGDEVGFEHALESRLRRHGHSVSLSRDADAAMQIVRAEPIDLVLCDYDLPGRSGIELVARMREHDPDLPCIVMTGHDRPEDAAEALRAGAFCTLAKSLETPHLEVANHLAETALAYGRLGRENRRLMGRLQASRKLDHIIGKSPRLARALARIETIAGSDGPVLVTGESGTGKSLVARALHDLGRRANRPFVAIHCGALPEPLLEAELFGHAGGALPAAPSDRAGRREGRIAAAHGGTLFLDSIGDLGPRLQARLLRLLAEQCFEPIGSSEAEGVDVRVVAATPVDLGERVADGRFRADLVQRLQVVTIDLPPLRERIEDLPLLVHHFLDVARNERGSRIDGVRDEALQRLMDYHWPGNVRELENLIEALGVRVGAGEIEVHHLPDPIRAEPALRTWAPRVPSTGLDFNDVVTRFENDLIAQALERTSWNKNRAAGLLGLNRTTLLEKIKKRGLQRPGPLL